MSRPLISLLEEKLLEYEDRAACGATSWAVLALGKGLRLAAQSPKDLSDFVRELHRRVQPEHLHDAATKATASWRRAMRVMSVGTKFNDDEILLLFTLRQEVELVSEVLEIFGINTKDLPLAPIDDELRMIANANENRRDFGRAFRLMKKNCGIPIEDIWSK